MFTWLQTLNLNRKIPLWKCWLYFLKRVPWTFSAKQTNNKWNGDRCCCAPLCWRGTTSSHPFSEWMAGFWGKDLLCGQRPPLPEARWFPTFFPVPLSKLCWKSQLSERLDNTCNFHSRFRTDINRKHQKSATFMKPPHSVITWWKSVRVKMILHTNVFVVLGLVFFQTGLTLWLYSIKWSSHSYWKIIL